MGYDAALDYVRCTVRSGSEVLYSNLGDEEAGTTCKDVEYYRAVLENLGIEVPEEMFEATKKDQASKSGGDKIMDHTPTSH